MNTKKAMEIKRRKTPTAPELFLQAVSAYPCIFYWSDGSQSETSLGGGGEHPRLRSGGKAQPRRLTKNKNGREECLPSVLFPRKTSIFFKKLFTNQKKKGIIEVRFMCHGGIFV